MDVLQLVFMGFIVVGFFSLEKQRLKDKADIYEHLVKARKHLSEVTLVGNADRSHIAGLHDKYAKLYNRLTELEKIHEVHSRSP